MGLTVKLTILALLLGAAALVVVLGPFQHRCPDSRLSQLTLPTNERGEYGVKADPAPTLSPYVIQMPTNWFADANRDKIEVGSEQNADGDPGWFFNPETGDFRANDAAHMEL